MLFSFARWTDVVMKTYNFSTHVDIFLPIYNPGGIRGLQIPQSRIPRLRKGVRDCTISMMVIYCSTDGLCHLPHVMNAANNKVPSIFQYSFRQVTNVTKSSEITNRQRTCKMPFNQKLFQQYKWLIETFITGNNQHINIYHFYIKTELVRISA